MTDNSNTAILFIDPYNDFIHPNGKLYGLLADSLAKLDTISHLKEVLSAARAKKIPVYYGLHQQHKPGFIVGWKHANSTQQGQAQGKAF
jgi:nicotinamidase-related amidase